MMAQTSLQAYVTVNLGAAQQKVFTILSLLCLRYGDATNAEVAMTLGWQINRVTPRMLELRDQLFVQYSTTRECRVTGATAKAWRVF